MRDLHAPVDATHHQTLFAPVELEGFTQSEFQRYKGVNGTAFLATPVAYKRGELAIAAGIAISLDLGKQRFGGPAIVLRTQRVGLECPFQRFVKVGERACQKFCV